MVSTPDLGDLDKTDRSLVMAVRDGDESAATELYQRYAQRVFGLVESQMGGWLRSTTEPEDIVQSVFKSMFRGVQAGNYDAPPGSTLWNLIAVIAVHKLRRTATRQNAQCRDVKRNRPLELTQEAETTSPPESIQFLELSVRETLELLRESDREVVVLRLHGHTIAEIAESTGRSRRTVERSLQRCRQRLADALLQSDS